MQEIRDEINEAILEADKKYKNEEFDEALKIYEETLQKAQEIEWHERVLNIEEMISDLKEEMRQRELQREKEELRRKKEQEKREKEKRMEAARERLKKKEEMEKKKKIQALKEKKRKENEMQNRAYDLLGEGSQAVQDEEYEKALDDYQKAIEIFEELNWPTEIRRTQEMIEDAEKAYEKYQNQLEKRQKDREKLEKAAEQHKELIEKSEESESKSKLERENKENKRIEEEKLEEKLSNKAFDLIDQGNEKADLKNFTEAIEKYREAKDLFDQIGWNSEAEKLLAQISDFKKKKQKNQEMERKKREKLEKERQEEESLQKKIEIRRKLEEKKKKQILEKQKEEEQRFKQAEETANKMLANIEAIEEKVTKYENQVKEGNILSAECPYEKAIETYRQAEEKLTEVGWDDQSKRMEDGIEDYKRRLARDKKQRQIEKKRIREKEEKEKEFKNRIEAAKRLEKKKREEELQKIQEEREKKQKEQETYETCMQLIDEANNYRRNDQFEEAIRIYKDVIEKYEAIDYHDGVRLAKDSLAKLEEEQKKYQKEIEEQIKIKELEEQEKEEIEDIVQKGEEKQKIMELQKKKKREAKKLEEIQKEKTQNEIIDLLAKGSELEKQKQFDEAIQNFREAYQLFEKIEWPLKKNQVHELILETEKKKELFMEKKEKEQKKREEEERLRKEQEELKRKTEEENKKLQEQMRSKEQEKMKQKNLEKQLENEAWEKLDQAEKAVDRQKYYSALRKLHRAYHNFKQIGWTREAGTTNNRFNQVFDMIKEPLVSKWDLLENKEIENAEDLFSNMEQVSRKTMTKEYDQAISQAKELKSTYQDTVWKKSLDIIEKTIKKLQQDKEEYQKYLKEKQEMPSLENANNLRKIALENAKNEDYKQAMSYAKKAIEMYDAIGNEKEKNKMKREKIRWKYKTQNLDEEIKRMGKK